MQIDEETVDFLLDDRMITVRDLGGRIRIEMRYRMIGDDEDPPEDPDYEREVDSDVEAIAGLCEAADW